MGKNQIRKIMEVGSGSPEPRRNRAFGLLYEPAPG
jgi:hypothetical protein